MPVARDRMPALYLSHGAPPLADHPSWPGELAAWSRDLPRPAAILMISAHWEEAPLALGAVTTVPLTYDFWGFHERYYQVSYAAPGAPELAAKVRKLLRSAGTPVLDIPDRGLDPVRLLEIGRKLAPLRDEGVLIIGSGFFTHNLRALTADDRLVPAVMAEFDDWGRQTEPG